jgi:hypothetical protein
VSINSINPLSSGYVQSILGSALQSAGLTTSNTPTSSIGASTTDNQQLSPFAQVLSALQQLQQSNPTQYAQVTGQIATNLQNAAQTAQSQGNTTAATALNQLATDFTNASKSGQIPNVQDLAQAIGGHHHHHHAAGSDSDSSSSSSAATSSASPTNPLSQLLAALQSNGSQPGATSSFNPLSIITSTLQSAGIGL